MKLWAAFPSGNSEQASICAKAWRERGYRVAVLVDEGQPSVDCDLTITEPNYRGTAAAFAKMFGQIGESMLCLNDDVFPGDGADADNMARLLLLRFPDTFGVLQATGDWYDAMAWCAPYPLIGKRYMQTEPWHEGYYHLHCDEELRAVAIRRAAYAELPDVHIEHRHKSLGFTDSLPAEKRAKNNERHAADRALYETRKAVGFP